MDHKAWLWRKKSAEKIIVSSDRVSSPLKGYEEHIEESYPNGRFESEKDTLSLSRSNNDDLTKNQEESAQEAVAARDKAEAELISLRKKLDECLNQRAEDEQRLAHLNSSLEECKQQLRFVREEQEQRIHDAVMKVSREYEKSRLFLENRLEETTKRLAKVVLDNSHLSKSLLLKERSAEELTKQRAKLESDFGAVVSRLESVERENASLKYEVRVLEKEVDIRNEEREFNRRSAEVYNKQRSESAKKVEKLESECQRLRLLVRKRLPGPAAPTRMRSEALTEQLTSMEEENRALREALERRKSSDLQVPRNNTYSRASSRLSQVGPARNVDSRNIRDGPSLGSVSDIGSDDRASCAESWASALISELENFRNEKMKGSVSLMSLKTRASEIELMDDFAEMEKLAVSSTTEQSKFRCCCGDRREVMNGSISKIVELLERITLPSSQKNYDNQMRLTTEDESFSSSKSSETPTGYMVRVFQWKTSELNEVLEGFLHTCYDITSEKSDLGKFGEGLAFTLEWILNHCFSLQDVSSMRDDIAKSFDWDEPGSDGEEDAGPTGQNVDPDKPVPRRSVEILRSEIENLKESKRAIEGQIESQIESHRLMNEDLDRQLSAARAELKEARKRSSSLEVELESENGCCEELENTCLDLQLQLESMMQNKNMNDEPSQEDKRLRTELEITAASEKLAECQETILNLGKQLKALASPKEAALVDKVVPEENNCSKSPEKNPTHHRPSLLDQMLAEDKAKANAKVTYDNPEFVPDEQTGRPEKFQGVKGANGKTEDMAIVPVKKRGSGSLWRKLLWRKKRVRGKKASLPDAR